MGQGGRGAGGLILASTQAKDGAGWEGAGGLILASTQAKDGAGWEGGWMVDPSIYPGQGWGRVGGGLEG